MNEQESVQTFLPARPATDDPGAWRAYWQQLGQHWRTEPEIDAERQQYLAERRAIVPDIEKGVYPFTGIKLSRADIEWLLATHEDGLGPVNWNDEHQRGREGVDMRAADLRHIDLQNLPLARLHGGLTLKERVGANEEQWLAAGALMEHVNLRAACLQGATLCQAQLQRAILRHAQLQHATLIGAQLQRAALSSANLQGTDLRHAQLEGAFLADALFGDEKHVGPHLADAHWDDTNLAVVDWSQLSMLGDEHEAHQKQRDGKGKEQATRLNEYKVAVRANRQFAVALQAQGLNEEAASFAYRSQKLQRVVLRLQRRYLQYLFSLSLDLLAGYGYRPIRTVLCYLIVVGSFATAYALSGHLSLLPDALVYSLTSFHGRGFFPGLGAMASLHNPLVVLAAAEAVIGLFIEISFIATFTQRFFGK